MSEAFSASPRSRFALRRTRRYFSLMQRILLVFVLLVACGPSSTPGTNQSPEGPGATATGAGVYGASAAASYDTTSSGQRESIKQTKVLFHHHSVGENIVGDWTDDDAAGGATELGMSFVAANSPGDYARITLGETTGGNNGKPSEKLASLKDIVITQRFGAAVDVVIFKFCFLDFGSGSDAANTAQEKALEAEYEAVMAEIAVAHPALKIIHVTPPINNYWNSAGNDLRAAFGNFQRTEYGTQGFVFDLQDIVSHKADGSACAREGVPVACDEYIGGSGHLSGLGATQTAKGLLFTILQTL